VICLEFRGETEPAIAKSKSKTSATADQLDRAFTLLSGSLSQHGDDIYRAGIEICLRELANWAPGVFVAMADTVARLFAEHPQPPKLLAERLHEFEAPKFTRQTSVSPVFASEMHEHYYPALFTAAQAAVRLLRKARQEARRDGNRQGRTLGDKTIGGEIVNQAVDALIRAVTKFEQRDRAAITAPVIFFLALPADDRVRDSGVVDAELGLARAFPALYLASSNDRRRLLAPAAMFENPERPTWGGMRNRPADVAAMLLVLRLGKGEITTPESWRDKVKQRREIATAKKSAKKRGV
jgi:hypothetical protein